MSDWDEMLDPRNPSPVAEEFDQSWPFNFKWAYNAENGQTDVWRVQGGTDGRPTHRAEVAARWGRDARVQDGDTLGLATYIPAEKKLDGTVVAPAEVRLQTYYGMKTPPSITEWFQRQFPGSVIREAVIVPKKLGKKKYAEEWDFTPHERSEPIYKWIWSKENGLLVWQVSDVDGEPWHDMKAINEWGRLTNKSDTLGYAFPNDPEPGMVSVEEYTGQPPDPQAFAAVKAQLAEWFPHDQIVNANQEQHEFGGDPADFHSAAVMWAWDNLKTGEERRSQNGLDGLIGVPGSPGGFRRFAGFFLVSADINELAQKARQNLYNREDLVNMQNQWLHPEKPGLPEIGHGNARTLEELANEGYTENPKYNPSLYGDIRRTLEYLPPELFKYYPWVVKQHKNETMAKPPGDAVGPIGGYSWQNRQHLKDILTQGWQHMQYLRSQPKNSPNAAEIPDINQLQYPDLEKWVYDRNALGIDVRPGTQWEYNEKFPGSSVDPTLVEYPHTPQRQKWDVGDGYQMWPVWSENDLKQEGNMMGHCVGGYCQGVHRGSSVIFSLRDSKGEPHVTLELEPINSTNPSDGYNIIQIQGKSNQEPAPEYKEKVKEFFRQMQEAGYPITYRINIDDTNDLEQYEYAGTPTEDYGVPVEANVDLWSVARELAQEAADGYGSSSDGLDKLRDEGIIDERDLSSAMREECESILYDKRRELEYDWQEEKDKLERHYEEEKENYGNERAEQEYNNMDPDDEDAEEPDPDDYEDEFQSFEDWLEEHYPEFVEREYYGFEQAAEDELPDVVDLMYRYGSTWREASAPTEPPNYRKQEKDNEACKLCKMMWKGECWGYGNKPVEPDMVCDSFTPETKTAAAGMDEFKEGDLVARAQDPEGKWIKPSWGEVIRVYRDPINHEPSAVVRWDYPQNPDGFVETALPFTNIVPFQHQMDLDLGWKFAADDYLDWSGWEGAHRFVTDGKEILTDPETERINRKAWAFPEELGSRFRSIYPDGKGFAQGWVVPTADKMGVGIYAPAAGHGDTHEPGLHDIIAAVEKEFGKPAHFITNPDHLSDEKMYSPMMETEWQEL